MDLIIVESPTKARTIERFLGKKYKVTATMGHIRDLPASELGVDTEHDFKPKYVLVAKRRKEIKKLKSEIASADKIYLATDPDREGEAISYHVTVLASKGKKTAKKQSFFRITFHEITSTAIETALAHPGKVNLQLVDAQTARRILDRLVGYKLSPLLWRKVRRGLSAGRVQSVAVRLIVDREREIEKFVPVEYWEIFCQLKKTIGQNRQDWPSFLAKLIRKNGKKIGIHYQDEAQTVVEELKKGDYEVGKVEKKEVLKRPVPPYITSTLQRSAYQKLRFVGRKTMHAAQLLYEKGLITYHRTDSVVLSSEAIDKIRGFIHSKYGPNFLPDHPIFYKTKSKMAQEAHEAIRPTDINLEPKDVAEKIGREESRLYELIFKRTLASQMKPAVYDQTIVWVNAVGGQNIYCLKAEGSVIKFLGWLVLYESEKRTSDQNLNQPEVIKLPPLERSDQLVLLKVDPQQKFTQPLPRYNDASLIKALEEKGIGRPSTYAPIIFTILLRQYIEREEGKLKPTPLGTTVNDFLLDYFPDIFDYDFTAKMENNLDQIAQGKMPWIPVIKEFYDPFNNKLEAVGKVAERVAIPTEATDQKCPLCLRGQLVIRIGRFGKFLSCSRFPECKYTAPFVEKLEGVKCSDCGGNVVVRKSRKGRRFFGCSNYPKCKWASWQKPKKV